MALGLSQVLPASSTARGMLTKVRKIFVMQELGGPVQVLSASLRQHHLGCPEGLIKMKALTDEIAHQTSVCLIFW